MTGNDWLLPLTKYVNKKRQKGVHLSRQPHTGRFHKQF